MGKENMVEVTNRIFIVREQKVMLDRDLAELYGVELKRLNEQVKRNIERFPEEFMFQLNSNELTGLWSQFATIGDLSTRKYIQRNPPFVFTEAGCFALSFVLKTEKAIEMGKLIIKSFTHLRRFILKNENLMMELKNNDGLSKTFNNFEKRIEQDLIVLYKNTSDIHEKFEKMNKRIRELEKKK